MKTPVLGFGPEDERVLYLDPGRQGPAWAVREGRRMVRAEVVPPTLPRRDFERAHPEDVAASIVDHIVRGLTRQTPLGPVGPEAFDRVVCEFMVHYPPKAPQAGPGARRGPKEDARTRTAIANDLIDLASIAGPVAGYFCHPRNLTYVPARAWKGSTSTEALERRLDITTERGGFWLPGELDLWMKIKRLGKTVRHNAVDVMVMGLQDAGRFRVV